LKTIKFSALAALTLGFSIFSLTPTSLAYASKGDSPPIITHEKQGDLDITSYYYENPVSYDFKIQETDSITPFYIPIEPEYLVTTTSKYKKKSWGTVIKNDSSVNDSVTKTVSRTTFANGSIGASAETAVNWKLIQGKVGIKGEVSWGASTTTSISYTWNLPARTTTTIATGSMAVLTTGSIVKYKLGKVSSRTPVNADYSYDEYSDKVSKPL
jgi:hypothetical protein